MRERGAPDAVSALRARAALCDRGRDGRHRGFHGRRGGRDRLQPHCGRRLGRAGHDLPHDCGGRL
eukprot:7387664-Prymnesium_polylepis.2